MVHAYPTPPTTPVAGNSTMDLDVLSAIVRLSIPDQGSDEAAQANEQNESAPLDIDGLFATSLSENPWKLCFVKADAMQKEDSYWARVTSTPGMYSLGKRLDGYYEVAVDESYIPWLVSHGLPFLSQEELESLLGYDPARATRSELQVNGWGCFYLRFLSNFFKAIWSRNSRGLQLCLRSYAPPDLQAAFEWAILSHDVLTSKLYVQDQFTLCLLLLALSLHTDYDNPTVTELLERDQDDLLKAFGKDPQDLLRESAEWQDREEFLHYIGLVQRLFVVAGGQERPTQLELNPEYTAFENLNFLGRVVGVQGANRFGNFDLQAMLDALRRSKAVNNKDIDAQEVDQLSKRMMFVLPIRPRVSRE